MTAFDNEVCELSADEIDMINGAGLSWSELGSFFKSIADEIVQLIVDIFD